MDLRRTRFLGILVCLAALGAVLSAPSTARASGFDIQQFHPMPDQEQSYFVAPTTSVASHGQWSLFTIANFGNKPLVVRNYANEFETDLVSSQATVHLLASVALFERVELGMDLPIVVHQRGDASTPGSITPIGSTRGIADLRLVPRVHLFSTDRGSDAVDFSLAGLIDTHLPTGNSEVLRGGDFRVGPSLAFEALFPPGFSMGTHVGYQYRRASEMENLRVDDTIGWGLFGEVPVGNRLRIIAELFGRITPSAGLERRHSPMEFTGGVKSPLGPAFVLAGVGVGLINGYGTPNWRGFVGIGIPTATADAATLFQRIPPSADHDRGSDGTGDSRRIEVSDRIHFEVDSAALDPQSHATLDEVVELLVASPEIETIRIEGHTDNRGSREHNIELSRNRAASVRDYLVEQGIDAGRLTTRGVGPDEPIGDNDTEEGRRENRRVEFHIID